MRKDGLAEEMKNENKNQLEVETKFEEFKLGEYKTPHEGIGSGAMTRPTPVGRRAGCGFPGF